MKITKELLNAIGFQPHIPAANITGDPDTLCAYGLKIHPCRAKDADDQWVLWKGSQQSLVDDLYQLVGQIYGVGRDNGYRERTQEVKDTLLDLIEGKP